MPIETENVLKVHDTLSHDLTWLNTIWTKQETNRKCNVQSYEYFLKLQDWYTEVEE